MTVTDTVSGSNYVTRSVRESLYLPSLGQGTPTVLTMGDVIVLLGTLNVLADSNGIRADIACSAAINANSAIYGDQQYIRAQDIESYIYFRYNHTSNIRIFIGFSDNSAHNMVASDSPTGNYFGLWFSTTNDASNFYSICSDGTHITKTLLFSVDSNYHDLFVRLYRDSGNAECQLQIDDNTFNGIGPSFLPGNTNMLRFIAANMGLDGASKHTEIGKVSIKQSR